MKSIRTYLLLTLLAIITLVTFVSLLQGYNSSISKAHQLFDERLQNMAEVIATANQVVEPQMSNGFIHSQSVFFQIWHDDLTLLARSNNAPNILITDIDSSTGFKDVNFASYRWRTFTLRDDILQRWIITAERTDIRYGLAENIVLASIIPIVLAVPISAFIIWLAIGLGLKPLKELATQLSRKQADDLSPIMLKDTPEELSQLVTTTNDLLTRLHTAFTREQQFSADAAHELRTPISILKVQLHNLQTEHDNRLDLHAFAQGIDRMGQVIEQILSLYQHSPDQALLKQENVDLAGVVQQVIAEQYELVAAKNQTISLINSNECLLSGDQFALETLVQNLIVNASKYTPEKGEVSARVTVNSEHIELSIEDSGPGIEQQHYERVFERFYRIHGDRHHSNENGCGLGLAIVSHIVALHNAEITLQPSITLGGLKVMIIFPLTKDNDYV
ncbi:MAG: HAMP domain-containing protein [Methylococcaceae bacterium]|nr:HAMP domain-containing protein [Methylococcaceae bacterium]